jgi:hypothetical protein
VLLQAGSVSDWGKELAVLDFRCAEGQEIRPPKSVCPQWPNFSWYSVPPLLEMPALLPFPP